MVIAQGAGMTGSTEGDHWSPPAVITATEALSQSKLVLVVSWL